MVILSLAKLRCVLGLGKDMRGKESGVIQGEPYDSLWCENICKYPGCTNWAARSREDGLCATHGKRTKGTVRNNNTGKETGDLRPKS